MRVTGHSGIQWKENYYNCHIMHHCTCLCVFVNKKKWCFSLCICILIQVACTSMLNDPISYMCRGRKKGVSLKSGGGCLQMFLHKPDHIPAAGSARLYQGHGGEDRGLLGCPELRLPESGADWQTANCVWHKRFWMLQTAPISLCAFNFHGAVSPSLSLSFGFISPNITKELE